MNNNRISDGKIAHITYQPNGADHEIQEKITMLLHKLVMDSGEVTLGELGYLHCNTITATKGCIDIKLYFLLELATEETRQANSKKKLVPSRHFDMFSGYLFIGDVVKNVTFEKAVIPKYKVERNGRGFESVTLKNNGKVAEDDVMIIHCNLPVTMAAIEDISMFDPNFAVEYETVGKGGKSAVEGFITIADHSGHPVRITVSYTDPILDAKYVGFDFNSTIPYLMNMAQKSQQKVQNQHTLQQQIGKKSDKVEKKNKKKKYSGFNKFA